jgi:hypothetical protein
MRLVATVLMALLVSTGAWAQTLKGDPAATAAIGKAWDQMKALRSYRMKMAIDPSAFGDKRLAGEQTSMVSDLVTPDRMRMVMDMNEGTLEMIRVGDESATRTTLKEVPKPVAPKPQGMGPLAFLSMAISAFTDPVGFAVGMAMNAAMSSLSPSPQMPQAGVPDKWRCQHIKSSPGSAMMGGPMRGDITVSTLGEVMIDGAKTQEYEYTNASAQQGRGFSNKMHVYLLQDGGLPRRIEMLGEKGTPIGTMDYYDYNAPITIEMPKCGT